MPKLGCFFSQWIISIDQRLCVHQVEGVTAEVKNELTSEILRRVDLENQVQTLKEQLELHRNISEQVIHTRVGHGHLRLNLLQLKGLLYCRRRSWRSGAGTRVVWWRWTREDEENSRVSCRRRCSSSGRTMRPSCSSTKRSWTGPSARRYGCRIKEVSPSVEVWYL